MSELDASVSICSRDHQFDIRSEATPSINTFLTQHLAAIMSSQGTNTSLSLSPHYTPIPGSVLVCHVSIASSSAVFLGGPI